MMEAHESLEEHHSVYEDTLPGIIHHLTTLSKNKPMLIDWQKVTYIDQERDGLPHDIGFMIH